MPCPGPWLGRHMPDPVPEQDDDGSSATQPKTGPGSPFSTSRIGIARTFYLIELRRNLWPCRRMIRSP